MNGPDSSPAALRVTNAADHRSRFGERLRGQRLALGLTQEELAEKAGMSVRAISDLERGRIGRPRRSTLRKIAEALEPPGPERPAAAATGLPPLAQLPADLADFTGRGGQLERLTALLTGDRGDLLPGAVAISALAGAGGIGKTALAVHAAHRLAPRFPDGQLYLNMRGSSPHPVAPADALARLLRDLGTDPAAVPAEESERAARYRSRLAGLRLLILLDDARDAAQIRPLLPGTGGCAVLVTSRGSLQDLESAAKLDLGILSEADGAALFARIVGPARAAAEPNAVADVLAACGGLPLAIRIAAARVAARPGWSVGALAARLGDAHRRLDELQAGDLAVRASFMVSYANVQPTEGRGGLAPSRVFRMLSLADGPDIGLRAAAALLDAPRDQAERALELLIDAHLLESDAPGRYRFHDLLRVYAAERIRAEDDPADCGEAIRRLLRWYLHTAAAAALLINPRRTHVTLDPPEPGSEPLTFVSYEQALAWLDGEHANLVAAVSQAGARQEDEIAWKLAITLWDLLNLRGLVGDWIATQETGLVSARRLGDQNAESWLLIHLAGAYFTSGRPLAAIECLRQTLRIDRELGDVQRYATGLYNLGIALTEVGRSAEAMEPLREALGIFRDNADYSGEASALTAIGVIYRLRGQFADAMDQHQGALVISRKMSDPDNEGETLIEMSMVHLELGQFESAIREATAAAELNRRIGRRFGEARAMSILGSAHRGSGRLDQTRRHWLRAIAIYTELGYPQAAEVAADLAALDAAGSEKAGSEKAGSEKAGSEVAGPEVAGPD
jgi:tetratricopeptide (TPR) repeat protein/transcriptional regulator with XRE-family HTH domain